MCQFVLGEYIPTPKTTTLPQPGRIFLFLFLFASANIRFTFMERQRRRAAFSGVSAPVRP